MNKGVRRFGYILVSPLLLGSLACGDGGPSEDGASSVSGGVVQLALDVEYSEPFSFLSGVRELPDGRLLAADPLSQVVVRMDLDAQTADTLGQVGGGPEEYRQPDQVFPWPGDSTLLVDIGKTYLTIIGPDGSFHDGMSMAVPSARGMPSIIMPRAVDGMGRLYFPAMSGIRGGPPDSTTISRYDRATETTETVGRGWRTPPITTRSGENVRMSLPRMMPNDDWAVGTDGRLAIVRANGYQVEWHLPDGRVITGPETDFDVHPISYADKEADLEQSASGGLSVSVTRTASGETNMQMSRGGSLAERELPTVEDQEWGETFPPFRTGGSVVSPADELWVMRWLPVDQPAEMDIFGPDGVKAGSVEIPADSRLLGFGTAGGSDEVAYFVRTDEVGLQWLSRYRVVRN